MSADSFMGEVSVTSPCGHSALFDAAFVAKDEFICPDCGLWWKIEQEAPKVLDSGFLMPGDRHVVVGLHA